MIASRLAAIQLEDLAQFIKARPSGVVVDEAALLAVPPSRRFLSHTEYSTQKQYKPEWREERNTFARNDLQEALDNAKYSDELKERVVKLLEQTDLVPAEENTLKRGEFASAYRNYLEDHQASELKALKIDAWTRTYRLFNLPESNDEIYKLINPYRRGYFIARDMSDINLDEMEEIALADIAQLEKQAHRHQFQGKRTKLKLVKLNRCLMDMKK